MGRRRKRKYDPSPLGRAIVWLLCVVLTLLIVWLAGQIWEMITSLPV